MQDAIRFLERLGQDVAVGGNAYAALLAAEVADGAARDALAKRDAAALDEVLGRTTPWFCMVATPDGDGDEAERPLDAPDEEREDGDDAEPAPGRRDAPD